MRCVPGGSFGGCLLRPLMAPPARIYMAPHAFLFFVVSHFSRRVPNGNVGVRRLACNRLEIDLFRNWQATGWGHSRVLPVGRFVSEASSRDPFVFSTLRQPRCMKWMALVGLMVTL